MKAASIQHLSNEANGLKQPFVVQFKIFKNASKFVYLQNCVSLCKSFFAKLSFKLKAQKVSRKMLYFSLKKYADEVY